VNKIQKKHHTTPEKNVCSVNVKNNKCWSGYRGGEIIKRWGEVNQNSRYGQYYADFFKIPKLELLYDAIVSLVVYPKEIKLLFKETIALPFLLWHYHNCQEIESSKIPIKECKYM
jgi:hypothetical protein